MDVQIQRLTDPRHRTSRPCRASPSLPADAEQPSWPPSAGLIGLLVALVGDVRAHRHRSPRSTWRSGSTTPRTRPRSSSPRSPRRASPSWRPPVIMTERLGRRTCASSASAPSAAPPGLGRRRAARLLRAVGDLRRDHPAAERRPAAAARRRQEHAAGDRDRRLRGRRRAGGGGVLLPRLPLPVAAQRGSASRVAAIVSGLIFGAIHLKLEYLVPLAILGTALALLFQKTGSLWPCIMRPRANNALALCRQLGPVACFYCARARGARTCAHRGGA